jgi:hypothetical protein
MPTDEDVGGSGGECSQPTTRDVRLVSRALRESWDIPDDTRRAMLDRLGLVVTDPDSKLRAFFIATRTMISLSRLNLQSVDVAIRARVHEELEARVAELEARVAK